MNHQNEVLLPYLSIIKNFLKLTDELQKENEEEFKRLDTNCDGVIEEIIDFSDIEDLCFNRKKKEVYEFLDRLDFSIIKILFVIMYTGKDCLFIDKDNKFSYEYTREKFDIDGWREEKNAYIMQMMSKNDLGKYMRIGCERIGLVI